MILHIPKIDITNKWFGTSVYVYYDYLDICDEKLLLSSRYDEVANKITKRGSGEEWQDVGTILKFFHLSVCSEKVSD